jgi:hypothetical protein
MLDIPDEVSNKVITDGNAAWLDALPSVVASLAQEWSLTLGAISCTRSRGRMEPAQCRRSVSGLTCRKA